MESLPKVNSRKEFMDTLSTMIIPPKEEMEEEETRGRLRELKTYVVESNTEFPSQLELDGFTATISNTGVDDLKILEVFHKGMGKVASFYVDLNDKRFVTLYTNSKADYTHKFHEQLTRAHKYVFDRTWFSTGMLDGVSKSLGNAFHGVGVDYVDVFSPKDFEESGDEFKLEVAGGRRATRVLDVITHDEEIKRTIAFNKVRVIRGTKTSLIDFVEDDLTFQGVFSVKSGKSVDDHITLVEMVKRMYKEQMKIIEDKSIGARLVDGRTLIEGQAFDFEFTRSVSDWDMFLNKIFDSTAPFQLWGLKEKIDDNYIRVLAVDLHTGHPINLEMTDNLIRVYLQQGSCGNVVLRLFVNLQQYFDSTIHCEELT